MKQERNASTLALISRHRQARELLAKSSSTGALSGRAATARPPQQPQTNGTRRSNGLWHGAHSTGDAAQETVGAPKAPTIRPSSASATVTTSATTTAGKLGIRPQRPRTAGAARPTSAVAAAKLHFVPAPLKNHHSSSAPTLHAHDNAGAAASAGPSPLLHPRRPRSLDRLTRISSPANSDHHSVLDEEVDALPLQGQPLLPPSHHSAHSPLSALPPLPKIPSQDQIPSCGTSPKELPASFYFEENKAAMASTPASSKTACSAGEDPDGDFTAEELLLEREVEQALNELEAADAAVTALKQQLENATDELEDSCKELDQLHEVAESWELAAEEGRRELADRQQHAEALLAAAMAARRETLETKHRDITSERLRVLENQNARLEEQVAVQQAAVLERLTERKNLARQGDALINERTLQMMAQRDARSNFQAVKAQFKAREEAVAASAKRRHALERQVVKFRGEANGLRARLDRTAALQANTPACAPATITATNASPQSYDDARLVSLGLQREIVDLWEAMRSCDDEASSLRNMMQEKGLVAVSMPAAAG